MKNIKQPLLQQRLHTVRYKVYIAGKVTGIPYNDAFDKFQKAELMLTKLGLQVINPMRIVPPGCDWKSAMRLCIASLCQCNAIYLLSDWKESKGACMEYTLADSLCIKLINDAVIEELQYKNLSHYKTAYQIQH